SYSRVDPVRYAATGAELRSRVRRSEAEDAALAAAADGLLVMQLQGFLFFGTTARVLERAEAAWRERPGLTVLLDLSRVTGIDASGLTALRTLGRRADANGSRLWLAAVPPAAAAALGRLGEAGGAREPSRFASVDAALEAWESEVLATAVPAAPGPTPTGDAREPSMAGLGAGAAGEQATGLAADAVAEAARLAAALAGSGVPPESLAPYVERVALAGGEELFAQGDPSDALYLVASGRVTSLRLRPGAEPERLETMRAGHAVGEVGILTGAGSPLPPVARRPPAHGARRPAHGGRALPVAGAAHGRAHRAPRRHGRRPEALIPALSRRGSAASRPRARAARAAGSASRPPAPRRRRPRTRRRRTPRRRPGARTTAGRPPACCPAPRRRRRPRPSGGVGARPRRA